MKNSYTIIGVLYALAACQPEHPVGSLSTIFADLPAMEGKADYLSSPFVTAGDRLYMVGHQDGTFPDHGWHVAGEMGGIWDHPIKLMDGFAIGLATDSDASLWVLNEAEQFTNYPIGNQHVFRSEERQLTVTRSQFVPDQVEGLVVELMIANEAMSPQTIFLNFTALVDLTPVWLSEELQIQDGADAIFSEDEYMWAKDSLNDWFAAWTTDAVMEEKLIGRQAHSPVRKGLGEDGTLRSTIVVPARGYQTIRYFLSGSDASLPEALSTLKILKSNALSMLQDKITRYDAMTNASSLMIPDEKLAAMYSWTKYNTDWLIRDVEGLGRGLSAGMADYPWWFGADNCYSLQGLLATGQHEEVFATIDLIFQLSKDANGDNGRIMHEASTNGVVFNAGNLNETPHFIYLLWKVYEWTGDETFLREYFDEAEAGFRWIMEQDHDDNGYADGPGMMEIPGLHTEMIDVVAYTQQAAWALGQMAGALQLDDEASRYDSLADVLRVKINSEWWSEESGSFADFRATRSKTLALIDEAIIRSDTIDKPWAVTELQQTRARVAADTDESVKSQVVYHNWVVNTPMEMGIADRDKAQRALAEARKYRSKYGTYVTGLDRDESQSASSKWEVFSYVGAVMTLPTGVQAIAEANYGNANEAYVYMQQLTNSFGYALPGATYEVSPDYGMMAQAWNIYAVAVPIVTNFFGIKPKAHLKEIHIKPNMPTGWDQVSISNVRVGDNAISYTKTTEGDVMSFDIRQELDWDILFFAPVGARVVLDNIKMAVDEQGYVRLSGNSEYKLEVVRAGE